MTEPLTPEERRQLVDLLHRLAATGGAVPAMPPDVWRAVGGVVPQLAVELLLTRDGSDLLLIWRDDPDWLGWHLTGGYVGCGESAPDACSRIAQREVGIDVRLVGYLGAFTWPDHPFAHTVSLLCLCVPTDADPADAEPALTDGEWFTAAPAPIVANHHWVVPAYFAAAPHPIDGAPAIGSPP